MTLAPQEQLNALRRRLIDLNSSLGQADNLSSEAIIEAQISNVQRAIAHFESELKVEQFPRDKPKKAA